MYTAIVAKLKGVRKHTNADRLLVATVYGNQVVVGLDAKENDPGIYFPSDGRLSEEYCKANDLIGYKDEKTGERKGGYFDANRKVRCQKFRGEKSDGFFMPLDSLYFTGINITNLKEGDQFTELGGIKICEKYITKHTRNSFATGKIKREKAKVFTSFHEHIDTEQFMYNLDRIKTGSLLTLTEKVHGTSARSSYARAEYNLPQWKKIVNVLRPTFKTAGWEFVSGTRRVVLDNEGFEDPTKSGYYGDNEFRQKYHDTFKNNLKKGETIYYEIVGWAGPDKPIMPIADNAVLKDKEFVKKYGDTTCFKYGCVNGTNDIYVYRISLSNEDGFEVDYSWEAVKERCYELGVKHVKEIAPSFLFNGNRDELKELVESVTEGESLIDPSHIREGVVVRIENGKHFYALKNKGFCFKVLEGIIKENDSVVDIEESQDFAEGPQV